ncbi:MAG TPA: hypothetical protein VM509_13165 [Planctomycetota bacterium]|nr:hypothetical protein [Planctomycetota bacterium]
MNPTRYFLSALLASPVLLALEPRGDALTFHPTKDSTLTKVNEMTMSFELGDMSVIVDGNDVAGSIPADISGEMNMSITWTDKYVEFKKDGAPKELIRSYEEMKGSMDMNGAGDSKTNDIPEFDALSGKSIKFAWNEEKGDYDKTFHDCEGEDKLLKTQQVDMDWRLMLPTKEVAIGDKWEVPTDFVRQILDGIKNGDMGDDEAGIATILQDELFPQMEKLLDKFKTTCEYKGHRDEDGVDAGVISIAIEGKGDLDLKAMIEAILTEQIPANVEVEYDITKAVLGLSMTGKGELLWNMASGHVLSLDQSADFTVDIGFDASFEAQGQSQSVEAQIELPGKFTSKMNLKK